MNANTRASNISATSMPESAYVRKVICASIPLCMFLTFLLSLTYERSKLPPYADAEEDGVTAPDYLIDLKVVVFVYLWVALLCVVLGIYAFHIQPKETAFLRRFLDEGRPVTGDLVCPEDHSCYGICPQYGVVTYIHPEQQQRQHGEPTTYVRRKVRLYQNFSREWTQILVLPGKPLSGHPKSDMEMAYLVTFREQPAMDFLANYAAGWWLGNIAMAIYTLMVIGRNQYENEFPNGWMWFTLCIVAMPFVAYSISWFLFQRFMHWMHRGNATVLKEGQQQQEQGNNRKNNNNGGQDGEYRRMADRSEQQNGQSLA